MAYMTWRYMLTDGTFTNSKCIYSSREECEKSAVNMVPGKAKYLQIWIHAFRYCRILESFGVSWDRNGRLRLGNTKRILRYWAL